MSNRKVTNNSPVPTMVGTVLVLAAMLGAASCGPDMPAYSHFETLPARGWTPEEMRVFEPWPTDSASAPHATYKVRLCLRYKTPSPATATLVVEQESLLMRERRDTVTLRLLDAAGIPTGRGAHGLFTAEYELTSSLRLTDGYSIAVSPLDTIYSATDIGIILIPRF